MKYDIMKYDIMKYDVMKHDVMKYDIMKYDIMKYDVMRTCTLLEGTQRWTYSALRYFFDTFYSSCTERSCGQYVKISVYVCCHFSLASMGSPKMTAYCNLMRKFQYTVILRGLLRMSHVFI